MRTHLTERAALSLRDLTNNTEIVLPTALDRAEPANYKFQGLNWAPNPKFKLVQSNVISHWEDSDRYYKSVIDFIGVEKDAKPSFSGTPCRVSCGCAAYYFYFSKWNADGGAHARGRMRLYVPVVNPKRQVGPLNPRHLPGLCKHLSAYAQSLMDAGYVDP
jgi:hypothetical protein